MNKTKDKTMKEFLENNAYFVDFFNAYFFNGEKVLKPENCMELDSEMNDANMDLEKHVDVIRKYNDGSLYSAFIIENQSYVDASMVARAATYEYVAYDKTLKKLKKNRKNEKLPMVHILVFYTGERPWNAASKLSELVEVDERFKSYFHDYQMNLIEITGKSNSFGLVKSSVLKVVKTLTDVEWLDLKELEEKEEIAMCEAEKRWLEVKSKEWKAEGIELGIKQGIEQGIERGSEKKELEMYQKMMDKGFDIKVIASIFSVSEESIKKMLMKA